MKSKSEGSVVIAILAIIGIVFFLFERVSKSSDLFVIRTKSFYQKEQAKFLSLGSVNLAMALLKKAESGKIEKTEQVLKNVKVTTEDEKTELTDDDRLQSLYAELLPKHGLWQDFTLKTDFDGLTAKIRICLTCEDGKINLNKAFDFEKKSFNAPYDKLLKGFKLKNIPEHEGDLAKILAEYIEKDSVEKILDLSLIPLSKKIVHFYAPPETDLQGGQKEKESSSVSFFDLFTVWGSENGLNPFFLSNAVRKILSLPGIKASQLKEKEEAFKNIYEKIDYGWGSQLAKHKKEIEALYVPGGQDSALTADSDSKSNNKSDSTQKFENLHSILSAQIEPTLFCMLSYVEYGGAVQKSVALVKKKSIKSRYKNDTTQTETGVSDKKDTKILLKDDDFEVIRFYWL